MTATPQVIWPEATHRGYHSVSLLLKDGRILTGGGKDKTHATGCEKNDLRIYTPPYLRGNPTRPTITNIAEQQQFQIGSGNLTINYTGTLRADREVALVGLGSLTHAFDMGQRYVPLTRVSGGGGTGSITVKLPANINVAQPAFYNLFIINSTGVPSMGKSIRLTPPHGLRVQRQRHRPVHRGRGPVARRCGVVHADHRRQPLGRRLHAEHARHRQPHHRPRRGQGALVRPERQHDRQLLHLGAGQRT